MAAEHWFRWHHGTVNDPKWRIVAARASHTLSRNVTVGHTLAVWCAMLECASQASPRGTLGGWCDEDVAVALGVEEQEVAAIREAMQGKTLDGERVSAWNRRQIKRVDDTAAERKAAQRERERGKHGSVTACDDNTCHAMSHNVTHGSHRVTVETETETETETEKEETTSLGGDSSPPFGGQQPIVDAYNRILRTGRGNPCELASTPTDKLKRRLKAAEKVAKAVCKQHGWPYDPATFWAGYFTVCDGDPWMRGDLPNPKNPQWRQNLAVLLDDKRLGTVIDQAIESMRGDDESV